MSLFRCVRVLVRVTRCETTRALFRRLGPGTMSHVPDPPVPTHVRDSIGYVLPRSIRFTHERSVRSSPILMPGYVVLVHVCPRDNLLPDGSSGSIRHLPDTASWKQRSLFCSSGRHKVGRTNTAPSNAQRMRAHRCLFHENAAAFEVVHIWVVAKVYGTARKCSGKNAASCVVLMVYGIMRGNEPPFHLFCSRRRTCPGERSHP